MDEQEPDTKALHDGATVGDGGPAFPAKTTGHMEGAPPQMLNLAAYTGMSLRDWFAGQALSGGLIQHLYDPEAMTVGDTGLVPEPWSGFIEMLGESAYDIADAMLREREKRDE